MKTIKKSLLFVIIISLSVCWSASAMEGPPPILNPTTHVSPSGEYVLHVNPTDLHGRGPADYRFSKNGEILWTNRLPFTLWEVGVANSGHITGYAYTHGWRGFSDKGYDAGMGDFIVVILSPQGNTITQDVYPRKSSLFLDTPPNPIAEGIIVNELAKYSIIRVADPDVNRGIEQWWVYDLGTGARTATIEPESQMAKGEDRLWILAAKAVPGTPLTLVHWLKVDYPRVGPIFTLVDKAGHPVWALTLTEDYHLPSYEAQKDETRRLMREDGGILGVGTNGTFDLHLVKDGARASYSVNEQEHNKWKVETGAVRLFRQA